MIELINFLWSIYLTDITYDVISIYSSKDWEKLSELNYH